MGHGEVSQEQILFVVLLQDFAYNLVKSIVA